MLALTATTPLAMATLSALSVKLVSFALDFPTLECLIAQMTRPLSVRDTSAVQARPCQGFAPRVRSL